MYKKNLPHCKNSRGRTTAAWSIKVCFNLDIVIDFYSDDFCAEDVEIQMLQARLDQTEQTLQKLIGKLGAERALYLTSNTDD